MELFNKYLEISGDHILRDVPALAQINGIVSAQGQIAHNRYSEEYLKNTVDDYYKKIQLTAKEIKNLLWNYPPEITDRKRPWQNTY